MSLPPTDSAGTPRASAGTGLSPLLLAVPALDNTFGALLLGTNLGLMLYGLSVHQTYRYFLMYKRDIMLLKVLVIVLFLVDTLHTVITLHLCYHYLVTNYFHPQALLYGVWSIRLIVPCSTVIILLGQAFYARRVYMLGGRVKYMAFPAVKLRQDNLPHCLMLGKDYLVH